MNLPTFPDPPRLLVQAHQAFSTRRVPRAAMWGLDTEAAPAPGDLLLARVEAIGHHTRLHLPNGRRRRLFVGDEVIVAYGDRYAPNQFEARVPRRQTPCHLVAGGGIAALVESQHARIRRRATRIRPLGLVTGELQGPPLNLAGWTLAPSPPPVPGAIPTLAFVGTSMDSGKTTAAANVARGLSLAGMRVGYAKVTGTAASGDPWLVADAGADLVLDFTDVGFASTYRISAGHLLDGFRDLLGHLQSAGVEVALLEVADGLLQEETARLVESEVFDAFVDGTVLAANDSMGASAGLTWLGARGRRVIGLAGALERAPLQVREAEMVTGLQVLRSHELVDPCSATKLLDAIAPGSPA